MKKRLTADEMITFFAVLVCCDTTHILTESMLMEMDEIWCSSCGEPLAYRSDRNGLWYTVGSQIFE